ncbi:MAG: tetratricopeptide repeat protein [Candidatus Omnitrophica bacterium]|nr:tetratricopeptide repeat protein [Candidatus Omnitrophota bacterium]
MQQKSSDDSRLASRPPLFARILGFIIIFALLIFGLTDYFKKSGNNFFTRLSQKDKASPFKYHQQARSLIDKGRFEQSEEAAKKALSLDPDFYRAYMDLGQVYIAYGEYIRAEQAYKKALELLKQAHSGHHKYNIEVAYYNLGYIYELEKQIDKSWENYRKAYEIRVDSKSEFWDEKKYKILKYVKENDKDKFSEYILNTTALPDGFFRRKEAIQKNLYKRDDLVIKDCKEYLEHNPATFYAYNIYGIMATAFISKGDTDKALEALEKVKECNPPDSYIPWIKYSYAHIYYRNDDMEKAVFYAEDVLNNHPDYERIEHVRTFYNLLKSRQKESVPTD